MKFKYSCSFISLLSAAVLLIFCGCNGCSKSASEESKKEAVIYISPEDKLLNDYEKYVDDMIAEYLKIDSGDIDAYNNIAPLSEIGTEVRSKISFAEFNEEQQKRYLQIDEKRRDFFNNR